MHSVKQWVIKRNDVDGPVVWQILQLDGVTEQLRQALSQGKQVCVWGLE